VVLQRTRCIGCGVQKVSRGTILALLYSERVTALYYILYYINIYILDILYTAYETDIESRRKHYGESL